MVRELSHGAPNVRVPKLPLNNDARVQSRYILYFSPFAYFQIRFADLQQLPIVKRAV